MKVLLVVYDNDSYINWFPQGLASIAAVLEKRGDEVVIYNQDVHHYPDEHLTRFLDANRFDVVGVSVIAGYYQYRKLLKLSQAINTSKQRPFYAIGGHGPTPEPEYFLKKTSADVIVRGEGEVTVVELMAALEGHGRFDDIAGLAFMKDGKTVITPDRPLIKDIDSLPFPAYHLFPVEHYRLLRMPHVKNNDFVMPILSGRGCTFKCNFCYRMDPGFRPRSNASIIDEITFLKKTYGITYIAFGDELLMSSIPRTVSICEDFLKADLRIKWDCNGRLNYAQPDVLGLMKKAGCVFINYGIEALDDQTLQNMNKCLTENQIIKGIEATIKAGISPGFNVIFGNIGENADTLNKGVEFLLKYDDGSQLRTIRPVTPYPGSPLYYYAIKEGLLKDCADFYENKHTNSDLMAVNFTRLSDEEYYRYLHDANKRLLNNYYRRLEQRSEQTLRRLYCDRDASFRGFRQS